MTRLDSDVMRLRAQMEKGEAVRQNLEFEVVKLRRDLEQERVTSTERETLLSDVNDSLKGIAQCRGILYF